MLAVNGHEIKYKNIYVFDDRIIIEGIDADNLQYINTELQNEYFIKHNDISQNGYFSRDTSIVLSIKKDKPVFSLILLKESDQNGV